MRLTESRVPALGADEWTEEAAAVLQPFTKNGEPLNIFKTLAHHPQLLKRWLVFANHILGKSTLDLRTRELLILRIGHLCQAGYEWGQHVEISRAGGMSDAEIRTASTGSATPGLSEQDRLLFKATEELHADAFISEPTYQALAEHFNTQQLMDIVFTVGQYNLVSMALNTLGVQPDPGLPGWDI